MKKIGYYSTINIDVQIKPEHIERVRQELKLYGRNPRENELEFKNYFFCDLNIDDNGFMEYDDYVAKWYEEKDFVKWLKDFCTNGTIVFIGEDNEKWGYLFEDGKVFELNIEEIKTKSEEII